MKRQINTEVSDKTAMCNSQIVAEKQEYHSKFLKVNQEIDKLKEMYTVSPSSTVDAPGNDGNVSMPEQVERPNPWRKMMMMVKERLSVNLTGDKTVNNSNYINDCPIITLANDSNQEGTVFVVSTSNQASE
jgi:hypothetical protein